MAITPEGLAEIAQDRALDAAERREVAIPWGNVGHIPTGDRVDSTYQDVAGLAPDATIQDGASTNPDAKIVTQANIETTPTPKQLNLLALLEPDWRLDDEVLAAGKEGLPRSRAALEESRARGEQTGPKPAKEPYVPPDDVSPSRLAAREAAKAAGIRSPRNK